MRPRRARPLDLWILVLVAGLLLASKQLRAEPLRWTGFNLAGAEFGQLPGQAGTDYFYPSPSDVTELLLRGANIFRVPFRWERLQPKLDEAFDPAEASRLTQAVAAITSKGARVIVSPHNFGRYREDKIGSAAVPIASFARFWHSLALLFRDNSLVLFGLMNEPHDMVTEDWRDAANAALAEIRRSGASNLVLVPGNSWTGGQSWTATDYGTSNAIAMAQIIDPLDNFAYEIHQYFDEDYSGTHSDCQHADVGVQSLKPVTNWLEQVHRKAFLAEFGATINGVCLQAMDSALYFMEDHPDQWLGWTYWAAGGWWGHHPMTAQPKDGIDPPQLTTLMPHIKQP